MDRRQFETRSVAAAAGAALHRQSSYAAALIPLSRFRGRWPTLWYRETLAELARAIADGARVRAFHAWTLLDNFQWAEGYTERDGLIYTDFCNRKRTIKDSGLWYGRVAATNRLDT